MQTIEIPINELIPYWRNPRNNDATINRLCKSIEEFGFNVPIVVNKDKVLITGHARLKAAKKLGMSTVPCIVVDLTDEQAKKYRIGDNKIAELSTWNEDILIKELREIGNGVEIMDIGFSTNDVLKYLPSQQTVTEIAEAVAVAVPGVSAPTEEYVPKRIVEDKAKEVERLQAELKKREEELVNGFPKTTYARPKHERIVVCPHCGKQFKVTES